MRLLSLLYSAIVLNKIFFQDDSDSEDFADKVMNNISGAMKKEKRATQEKAKVSYTEVS